MAVAPSMRRPQLKPRAAANGPWSVLVVDDEVSFGHVLREVLESFGFEVRVTLNAEEALREMRHRTPDLLMVDVMMPEVDGLTLIRKVQLEPAWLQVPILVVSARASESDQNQARFAGADGFLAKPFTAQELRGALGAYLPAGHTG